MRSTKWSFPKQAFMSLLGNFKMKFTEDWKEHLSMLIVTQVWLTLFFRKKDAHLYYKRIEILPKNISKGTTIYNSDILFPPNQVTIN